jgi:acetyl-CoA synthetase
VATLREVAAKQLLSAAGIDVPRAIECPLSDAADAARDVGFPVAVKISNDAIAHKSDVGGVALSLNSTDEVVAAVANMRHLGDRVLIEQMIAGSVAELIVGVVRDPQFGLALLLGAGGVLAEVWEDNVTLLLPAGRADIEAALARLRIWRLISGYRGRKADAEAVVRAVEKIAAFADKHRNEIEELDINPLLALPDRAVAVDALIKFRAKNEFLATVTPRST